MELNSIIFCEQALFGCGLSALGPSHSDPNYASTRAFYAAMGFRPLEEFKQIWNEQNPCLILVKRLGIIF